MDIDGTLIKRLPTGSKALDGLLGGGFESGTISQIYGEPASGKTNICLQLAVNTLRAGKYVIYIDTEDSQLTALYRSRGMTHRNSHSTCFTLT